ncbi:hypothetical protein BGW80DRAFT_362902 [Lactifluus volemus]|nr:hypothetical protein BGW80DRAFT_362902 [Lactifluus volemus]
MAFLGSAIQETMLNTSESLRNCEISPIKALPDEILLKIFDFCRAAAMKEPYWEPECWPQVWCKLVHVCQRWRYTVFSSPLRLDLRLYSTDHHRRFVREMLDVWPSIPMEICCHHDLQDNNIAALEHCDRICEMNFYLPSLEYGNLAKLTQLQNPFPGLTCLRLRCRGFEPVPALPVTFLGGSAPSLRSFQLEGIPFPTLPQFLLSCNDLSELYLQNIPDLGYISPEAMVTVLSALTKLKCLEIGFKQPGEIRLAPPPPPPLTRSVLQSLTVLRFYDHGVKKYSEDLLSRIDVPHLETLSMVYEYDPHVFDIPQLISHSLRLGPFHRAEILPRRSSCASSSTRQVTKPHIWHRYAPCPLYFPVLQSSTSGATDPLRGWTKGM